jgi:hypothetical protein
MQSNIECAVYAVNMLAYCMLKMSAGILHAKNVRTVPGSDSRFRFQVPVSLFSSSRKICGGKSCGQETMIILLALLSSGDHLRLARAVAFCQLSLR